jgi:hypothetical protein
MELGYIRADVAKLEYIEIFLLRKKRIEVYESILIETILFIATQFSFFLNYWNSHIFYSMKTKCNVHVLHFFFKEKYFINRLVFHQYWASCHSEMISRNILLTTNWISLVYGSIFVIYDLRNSGSENEYVIAHFHLF